MSIANSYNEWSETYDNNLNKTRDLDQVATKTTLSRYTFDTVLELGCGTGKNTSWLMDQAKRVVGLDFSDGMLEVVRNKIQANHIDFIKCDLNNKWPIHSESFDLVTISLVLEHIGDLKSIFSQAYLHLQEGGKFYVCELHPYRQYKGSKARFESNNETQELETFVHHLTDFTKAADSVGFNILEMEEWFDNGSKQNIPRLISFVFEK